MAAPLEIILEMIRLVFGNTISTLWALSGLLGDLTGSLGLISGFGPLGFVVAAVVLGLALFFVGKFLLSSWKMLAVLFIAGLIILWLLSGGIA